VKGNGSRAGRAPLRALFARAFACEIEYSAHDLPLDICRHIA
jgi:hypothetical protein